MGGPNLLVPVSLAAFALGVVACFSSMPPRRAVLVSILGGWLFLPVFDGRLGFLVIHEKIEYVPAVVLLASLAFDGGRWSALRLRLYDLPAAVLCVEPFVTAVHNGLGAYEGAAAMFSSSATWGAPYLLGRVYLGRPRALNDLAQALLVAALVYAPLCLWEARMSPQLHYQLYGYMPFDFRETLRFGGYRPSVFMQSGLAVAMFMASSALIAYWRWRTGVKERTAGIPAAWLCLVLVPTTVLCKSTGATILLAAGIGVLEGTRWLRGPALLLVLALAPVAYCAARINGWHPERIVELSSDAISPERAASLQFRIDNEDMLIAHALQQPWLGWGRFGRALIRDHEGRIQSVVDGRWIITFGVAGLIGLSALGGLLALPAIALLRRYPARYWSAPQLASIAALVVGLLLWAIDEILNSMLSPIYPMTAGGLISFVLMSWAAQVERRVHPPQLDVSEGGRSPSSA